MAVIHKYDTPNSVETVLSTELNGLVQNGGIAVSSSAIDNTSGLYTFADFEIFTGQTIGQGDFISIFLIESLDGTNYDDAALSSFSFGSHGGTGGGSVSKLIGSIKPDSASTRKVLRSIVLPPTKFKVMLQNWCASQLVASGNTVKMIRYNLQGT